MKVVRVAHESGYALLMCALAIFVAIGDHFRSSAATYAAFGCLNSHLLEDIIHILHVVIEAEACVDLLVAQVCCHALGQLEVLLHLAAFHQRLHRHWLHEVVCLLTHKALLDERVHHALRKDGAVG